MRPTQQEIIELVYEDGGHTYPEWLRFVPIFALERLVHLALERFGAGGGEPTGYLVGHSGEYHYFRHKSDAEREKAEQERCSGESCGDVEPVFRHPSPTDLRAEYLRGLEDAKKIASNYGPSRPIVTKTPSQRIVGRWEGEQAASAGIADAIEALKGKQ